jgi:hypothetical protein
VLPIASATAAAVPSQASQSRSTFVRNTGDRRGERQEAEGHDDEHLERPLEVVHDLRHRFVAGGSDAESETAVDTAKPTSSEPD